MKYKTEQTALIIPRALKDELSADVEECTGLKHSVAEYPDLSTLLDDEHPAGPVARADHRDG